MANISSVQKPAVASSQSVLSHKRHSAATLPSLAKEGWTRHQENGPLPLKARPGWFVQQPIIGGLNQPPRLRPIRRLRTILLMGAATPPWPRRGAKKIGRASCRERVSAEWVAG